MIKNRKKCPAVYCIPAIILILLIIVFPIIYTGYISLTNMNVFHWDDYHVIGLNNYKRALFKLDTGFWSAMGATIFWTFCNMVIQVVLAFLIALMLNRKNLKLKRFYKTLLMFPWAMPAYVSILVWRVGMFNTEFGLLNKIITAFGGKKIDFLATSGIAFVSCTILNLWLAMPFMICMMDGALQSIDKNLYESAMLDGAGFIKKNFYITIPAIKKIMAPAIIMTTFTTFKQFDIVYLLTRQKGAMTGSSFQTIITYAHENAFVSNNYGLSSAVSMIIFIFIICFSIFTNRGIKEEQI